MAQLRHPGLKACHKAIVFETSPEQQCRFLAGRPLVIACIGGVAENVKRDGITPGVQAVVVECSITVKEHPTPFATLHFPASHVVGWPIVVGYESLQNDVVNEVVDVDKLANMLVVVLLRQVGRLKPIHHFLKLNVIAHSIDWSAVFGLSAPVANDMTMVNVNVEVVFQIAFVHLFLQEINAPILTV